jgi:hypothetical protein
VETGWSIRSPAWSRRAANFTGGWRVDHDHLGLGLPGFAMMKVAPLGSSLPLKPTP